MLSSFVASSSSDIYYIHVFRGILAQGQVATSFRAPPMTPEQLPRFRAPPAATPRSRPSRFQPSPLLPPRGAAFSSVPRRASPCFQPPVPSPPSVAASASPGRFQSRFQPPVRLPLSAASPASLRRFRPVRLQLASLVPQPRAAPASFQRVRQSFFSSPSLPVSTVKPSTPLQSFYPPRRTIAFCTIQVTGMYPEHAAVPCHVPRRSAFGKRRSARCSSVFSFSNSSAASSPAVASSGQSFYTFFSSRPSRLSGISTSFYPTTSASCGSIARCDASGSPAMASASSGACADCVHGTVFSKALSVVNSSSTFPCLPPPPSSLPPSFPACCVPPPPIFFLVTLLVLLLRIRSLLPLLHPLPSQLRLLSFFVCALALLFLIVATLRIADLFLLHALRLMCFTLCLWCHVHNIRGHLVLLTCLEARGSLCE